jgi:CBS domain-containing protein
MDLARNLKIESVSRLNPHPALQVAPSLPVCAALDQMRQANIGCVLVCEGCRLVGIFTERDLLRRVLAVGKSLSLPVSEVMTADPVTVQTKDPIAVVVRRMEEGGYRHLPVLDQRQKPVGVLSVKRVVRYLVEHFPATVYNLPPDPAAVPQQAEGA